MYKGGDVAVNKDTQSHHGLDKERMFEYKDEKKHDEIYKLLSEYCGLLRKEVKKERYVEIKKETISLLLKLLKEIVKENKRQKRNFWIVVIVSIVWLTIVILLFEFLFVEFELVSFLKLLGSVGSISSLIVVVTKHFLNKQDGDNISEKGVPFTSRIVNMAVAAWKKFKKKSRLHVCLFFLGLTVIGISLGDLGIVHFLRDFAVAGYHAVKNSDDGELSGTEVQVDEKVMKSILAGCDMDVVNIIENAKITDAEINTTMELSQKDHDLVFFNNQDYYVNDWTDSDEVEAVVLRLVEDYRAMKRENEFDKDVNEGGAPQPLRDAIAQASYDEITAQSFGEIKDNRDVREEAYALYPKKSLANLISNDSQKLAIILYKYGGAEEAIIYHFGQSILYDFECLQFSQNANGTVKDRLISIAQRYRDMVYTCPDMAERVKAQALAEAFEKAAKQY